MIVGMMTEAEYDRARGLASQSCSDPHFARGSNGHVL
jgi:hypothetical protein